MKPIGGAGPARGRAAVPRRRAALCVLAMLFLVPGGCAEPAAGPVRTRSRLRLVKQAGGARIVGIGPIRGFARGRDSTFVHCLELILEATGRPIGYDELMGRSGLAFRTQFRVDRWDVGNPDPLVGKNLLDPLFAVVGWEYQVQIVRRDEITRADALRQAIRRSIVRGVPVLAANIIPPEDWGIITGYRQDGSWLCRSYNGEASRTDKPAAGWPTAVVFLTRQRAVPARRPTHAASIRNAIKLFETRRSGLHALGDDAFDHWCQALRGAREREYIHPNFWTYIGLIDARAAAVRYLRTVARGFGERSLRVRMAADWYDKEVRLLLSGLKNVASERQYADSLPPIEMRDRQIDTLRQAQKLERSAIASLKKAVQGS